MSALAIETARYGRAALLDPEVRKPCHGVTNLFYTWTLGAKHGKPAWSPNIDMAKAVCARCALRVDCLDYALETDQQDGVWGGTTPWERARIVKRRLVLVK